MFNFIRKLIGIKRSRVLSDLDNLSLKEVNDELSKEEFNKEYTFGIKPENKECENCGSAMLKFDPEIKLGTRFLHACSRCDYREYF